MSNRFIHKNIGSTIILLFTVSISIISNLSCSVQAAKDSSSRIKTEAGENKTQILISPESPADTVRIFYNNLREKRFGDAMFLTNLRPAIDGLTENELNELQLDFAPLADQIPDDVAINGEIITGNFATVTAKLPDNETGEIRLQEIRLRQEDGLWVIMTVDEEAEKIIKKEGKDYFFTLKIETHQIEAKAMLNRIDKAQMVYKMQNGGIYADVPTLVSNGFLPEDVLSSVSTGYLYKIHLSANKKYFKALAEPEFYGKTGKLSYWFEAKENKTSILHAVDNKGKTSNDEKNVKK